MPSPPPAVDQMPANQPTPTPAQPAINQPPTPAGLETSQEAPQPAQNKTVEVKDQPSRSQSGFSTQHSLPIADIRDGVVVLKDGSFRVVVEAQAINFELMNLEEREGVEFAYRGFLNSLYFPVQIHIQSRRVDAEAYLKRIESHLKGQKNMLLSILTADYLDFLAQLLETTDIVDKNFYVVIPYFTTEFSKDSVLNTSKNLLSKLWYIKKKPAPLVISDKVFEQAKRELRYRLQTVQDGLRHCGVPTRVLSTKELLELYYKFYNPEMGLNQIIPNMADITAPIVGRNDDQPAAQPQGGSQ